MDSKMTLHKYGIQQESLTYTLHPQRDLGQFVVMRLDYLLGFIQQTAGGRYPVFLKHLQQRMQTLVYLAHFDGADQEMARLLTRFPNLQKQRGLARLVFNYYIQIVGITEQQFWRDEPLVVDYRIFSQSVFRFEYACLQAIVDTLGREEALDFFQTYRDQFNFSHTGDTPRIQHPEDLVTAITCMTEAGAQGRIRVTSDIADGQSAHRCANCQQTEMINGLGLDDLGLLEAVLFYGDYQVTIEYNVNFVLTRSQNMESGASNGAGNHRGLMGKAKSAGVSLWTNLDEHIF